MDPFARAAAAAVSMAQGGSWVPQPAHPSSAFASSALERMANEARAAAGARMAAAAEHGRRKELAAAEAARAEASVATERAMLFESMRGQKASIVAGAGGASTLASTLSALLAGSAGVGPDIASASTALSGREEGSWMRVAATHAEALHEAGRLHAALESRAHSDAARERTEGEEARNRLFALRRVREEAEALASASAAAADAARARVYAEEHHLASRQDDVARSVDAMQAASARLVGGDSRDVPAEGATRGPLVFSFSTGGSKAPAPAPPPPPVHVTPPPPVVRELKCVRQRFVHFQPTVAKGMADRPGTQSRRPGTQSRGAAPPQSIPRGCE